MIDKKYWTKGSTVKLTKAYYSSDRIGRIGIIVGFGRDYKGIRIQWKGIKSNYFYFTRGIKKVSPLEILVR